MVAAETFLLFCLQGNSSGYTWMRGALWILSMLAWVVWSLAVAASAGKDWFTDRSVAVADSDFTNFCDNDPDIDVCGECK